MESSEPFGAVGILKEFIKLLPKNSNFVKLVISMELSELFGAVGILIKSIKPLPKIGKLVALLALFYIVLSSIVLWIFSFAVKSLLLDMLVQLSSFPVSSSNPFDYYVNGLASIKEYMVFLVIIYVVILYCYSNLSNFSTKSIKLVSALSDQHRNLIKDLVLMVAKSWTRVLITCFYATLFMLGNGFFVISIVYPLFMFSHTPFFYVAVFITISAFIFILYLVFVWVQAGVISVMEESCIGVEKMVKAAVINLVYNLLSMIVFESFKFMRGDQWQVNLMVIAFISLSLWFLSVILLNAATFTAFFYFRGDEIELQDVLIQ